MGLTPKFQLLGNNFGQLYTGQAVADLEDCAEGNEGGLGCAPSGNAGGRAPSGDLGYEVMSLKLRMRNHPSL